MGENDIVAGEIYRHYKGRQYRVHATALHSESLEVLVVYEALYENPRSRWWVRPKSMFLEQVVYQGRSVARFELVSGAAL